MDDSICHSSTASPAAGLHKWRHYSPSVCTVAAKVHATENFSEHPTGIPRGFFTENIYSSKAGRAKGTHLSFEDIRKLCRDSAIYTLSNQSTTVSAPLLLPHRLLPGWVKTSIVLLLVSILYLFSQGTRSPVLSCKSCSCFQCLICLLLPYIYRVLYKLWP